MKSRPAEDETRGGKSTEKHKQKMMMMKKKNMRRLGGGGLSLEAFANAKSTTNSYNPALIKKQKEFYKNAKYVSKYRKSLKQQGEQNDKPTTTRSLQNANEREDVSQKSKSRNKKHGSHSLKELYENQREAEAKARMEREAIIQAKKEERERVEHERKAAREKMFKRTQKGQPVMKYRIEHLLQTIQGSTP